VERTTALLSLMKALKARIMEPALARVICTTA
jgi:hypothetical protein